MHTAVSRDTLKLVALVAYVLDQNVSNEYILLYTVSTRSLLGRYLEVPAGSLSLGLGSECSPKSCGGYPVTYEPPVWSRISVCHISPRNLCATPELVPILVCVLRPAVVKHFHAVRRLISTVGTCRGSYLLTTLPMLACQRGHFLAHRLTTLQVVLWHQSPSIRRPRLRRP